MVLPHNLRAPTSITQPEPVGVCDRCGFLYDLHRLVWQWDVRGLGLKNLRIRVCIDRCLDNPAWFLKPVVIGPDPIPPKDPRPPFWAQQESEGGTVPPADIQTFIFGD